jgi:ankyrin repeat protein
VNVVRLLLEKKADVNAKDKNGQTALMLASREGHREVKKLLLKAGAR